MSVSRWHQAAVSLAQTFRQLLYGKIVLEPSRNLSKYSQVLPDRLLLKENAFLLFPKIKSIHKLHFRDIPSSPANLRTPSHLRNNHLDLPYLFTSIYSRMSCIPHPTTPRSLLHPNIPLTVNGGCIYPHLTYQSIESGIILKAQS